MTTFYSRLIAWFQKFVHKYMKMFLFSKFIHKSKQCAHFRNNIVVVKKLGNSKNYSECQEAYFKKHIIIFQSTPAVNSLKFTRVYSHKHSEALLFNYIPSIIHEHFYEFANIFKNRENYLIFGWFLSIFFRIVEQF
jgi:hypothetical protein